MYPGGLNRTGAGLHRSRRARLLEEAARLEIEEELADDETCTAVTQESGPIIATTEERP